MKGKREIPLGLDMPFGEALARFIGTEPEQLPEEAGFKKKRRPKPPQVVDDDGPEGPTKPLD